VDATANGDIVRCEVVPCHIHNARLTHIINMIPIVLGCLVSDFCCFSFAVRRPTRDQDSLSDPDEGLG